jgi:gluconolactonase
MQIFATDVGFPEAPVLLPDDSLLIVEMSPDKGCITHLSADGKSRRLIARTGRPNGLARDRAGSIWVAETTQRAVLKMELSGEYVQWVTECAGKRFLFLNDLAFAPNGDFYVTDSGIEMDEIAPNGELHPAFWTLKYDGRVCRVDPRTREVELIDSGYRFTNGIAFGPDSALYVAETLTGSIYRYDYHNGRVSGRRELFGKVIEDFKPQDLKGPDGMKFGADGNLYVAVYGQGDITVLGRNGEIVRRIRTDGSMPTNLAFGRPGTKRIYVTEVQTGTVQVLDAGTDGLPLHA